MAPFSRIVFVAFALAASGLSCSSAAPADARWGRAFVAAPVFDDGIPRLANGTPLRGVFVEGEWRTHLGAEHRSGLRDAPGLEAPRVAWTTRVGIQGYTNTPLVAADVVYLTSQGTTHNAPDAEDGFYALDKSDGRQRWHTEIEEDINGGVLTDTLVVGGGDSGMLYAVRRSDGALAWSRSFETPHRHAPLERNGELWVSQRDGVHRISAATGDTIAVIASETDAYDNRGGLSAYEDAVYRLSGASVVERLDEARVLWSGVPSESFVNRDWGRRGYGPPLALPGTVIVQHDVNSWSPVEIGRVARYLDDGALVWEIGQLATLRGAGVPARDAYDVDFNAGTPWLINGSVWSNTLRTPHTVETRVENGEYIAQTDSLPCTTRAFASLVGVRDTVYRAHHSGSVFALSTSTGEVLWQYDVAYNANHRVREWVAEPGPGYYCAGDPYDGFGLFATPAIDEDGSLFVGSGEGWLYHIVED